MKKILFLILALLTFGFKAHTLLAGSPVDMKPYIGSKEFEQVKKLEGQWEGSTTDMTLDPSKSMAIAVHYHVTSGGSAVIETLFPGTPHEMVTVYTDENNKLAVTHYCMMRNQPHMILTKSSHSEISLEVPAQDPIVKSQPNHMHALTLDFSKPNQLTQKWTSYEKGKAKPASIFTFSRK